MMGPTGCHETSVTNYKSTLRKIPEERRSQFSDCVILSTRLAVRGQCTLMAGRGSAKFHLTTSVARTVILLAVLKLTVTGEECLNKMPSINIYENCSACLRVCGSRGQQS